MATASSSRAGAFLRCFSIYLAAFSAIIVWLPLIRGAFDGASYEWGTAYFGRMFSGAGLGGDYWFLIILAALIAAVVFLGLRRPGAVSYALLIGWHGVNGASWLAGYLANPGDMVFEGDTLGVSVNIGLAAVGFFAAGLLAALAGAALELSGGRRPRAFAWTRANTIALAAALALLPVQFFLLRAGEAHGATDAYGVILTMLQWALIVFAIGLDRKSVSKLAHS